MKQDSRIPFVVGCLICEKIIRKDGWFGDMFLFWIPELYKVQIIVISEDQLAAPMFSVCEACYNLAKTQQELFVTLIKARFKPNNTHE